MRKKLITFGVLLIFTIYLAACNSTADAIVDYQNDFVSTDFKNMEEKYIGLYNEYIEVVEESNDDIEQPEAFLSDKILPASQELLDLVKKNEFDDEEVQEAHNLLVKSEEIRHKSVKKEIEAVQNDFSQELILEAQDIVDEANEIKEEFHSKMITLIDEHDLEELDE